MRLNLLWNPEGDLKGGCVEIDIQDLLKKLVRYLCGGGKYLIFNGKCEGLKHLDLDFIPVEEIFIRYIKLECDRK